MKGGEVYACTEIYTWYWPLLFRHSRKMLYDDEQAMDVVQDIFTSLWFNYVALELNTSLSAYLYTSERNRTINMVNKSKLQVVYMESLQEYLVKALMLPTKRCGLMS